MFMPANTAPYWTYWFYGILGLGLVYYGIKSFFIYDEGYRQIDVMAIGEIALGSFLMYYWFVRVVI